MEFGEKSWNINEMMYVCISACLCMNEWINDIMNGIMNDIDDRITYKYVDACNLKCI